MRSFGFSIKLGAAVVGLSCVLIGYLEVQHRYNYGHYFGYGLHLDVTSRNSSIGIPGQTNMYEATLYNFSIFPSKLVGCDYVSDTLRHGMAFPYSVQRWNDLSKSWENVFFENTDDFCQPVPLGRSDTKRVSYTLWPG